MGRLAHPKLKHYCKFCNKKFLAKASDNRSYCGRPCQSKAIVRTDIRKSSICVVCHEEFKHYGERILCGRKCTSAYMAEMRLGDNNPAFKEKERVECKNCCTVFEYNRNGMQKDRDVRLFCSPTCRQQFDRGKSKDGGPLKFLNPYPREFSSLRKKIKNRDGRKCVLCGSNKDLHVHHIDYDEQNSEEENLITLCFRCHMLTNFERSFWLSVFSALLSGSKLVKKGWGLESHITNNEFYCLKYLIFFKGKRFSLHNHQLKKELWHCLLGEFDCTLQKNGKEEKFVFKKGDKVEVDRGLTHQLYARKNSIIIEVSTRDYEEDSIRLKKGD